MLSLLAAAAAALPQVALAQAPIRLVVGGPAGGNSDLAARLASDKVSQIMGTAVVVENRPGAGGGIAVEAVKNAKPDGTVVGVINAINTANETLTRNKGFNLLTDVEPVGLYVWLANVLIVTPALPASSVTELVGVLKARPATDYASGGSGSPGHLSGETFKLRTGVAMTHIPYKGAPPAVLSVITGETALMFSTASAALPQIKAGKVKALAVTSKSRLSELPDVPTLAEAGFESIDVADWIGFIVPKGTPNDVKQKLHQALTAAYADPAVREKLEKSTMQAAQPPLGPAAFGEFLAKDVAKWAKTIQEANIKAD
jgi:tripartite-type tricarboxylate transporter receptor subunit TctC